MEHRWGNRHVVDVPAVLKASAGVYPVQVLNASISGACVSTPCRIPHLSRAVLETRSGLRLEAYVVRLERHHLGLEWQEPQAGLVANLLNSAGSTFHAPVTELQEYP